MTLKSERLVVSGSAKANANAERIEKSAALPSAVPSL